MLSKQDTKLGEFEIEKGTEVAMILNIVHTLPEYYPEPKEFDPERFMDKSSNNPNKITLGSYLPFSIGRRACIGKLLAVLEIKFLLVTMLLKFKLKKPKDFKIEEDHFRGGAGVQNLPIIFEERQGA